MSFPAPATSKPLVQTPKLAQDSTPDCSARLVVRYPRLLLAGLTLACLLPFVAQPPHVDDPLFIWTAQHIAQVPADFYGFSANWFGTEAPMIINMKNPPLASYYLAVVGSLFGFHAVVLHLAMLAPAVLTVWGVYTLADRLGLDPLLSGCLTLAMPVFLMSATMLMCDVMLLACWTWGIAFWVDGIQRRRLLPQALAALCMALAVLIKYFGIALAPLLLVYALTVRKNVGWWLLWFGVPLATLVGYESWTAHLYGAGLLADAMHYSSEARQANQLLISLETSFVAVLFLGGCLLGVLTYAPRMWNIVWLVGIVVVICLISVAAVSQGWLDPDNLAPDISSPSERTIQVVHVLLMVGAGLTVLVLVVSDLKNQRDALSLMLALWVGGTFIFAGFLNWTVSGRSMLPIAPAVALLVARNLERCSLLRGPRRWRWDYGSLLFGLAVGMLGAWGNYAQASTAYEAAQQIVAKYQKDGTRLWFEGHWGFQYEMQRLGAMPLDYDHLDLAVGDYVAIPSYNTNLWHLSTELATTRESFEIAHRSPVITMRAPLHAGFYAAVIGRFPYIMLGDISPDRYTVYQIRQPLQRKSR
ncbi:MAG: glycosyltransferase family 39 protein [Pirellulales bacterium]|nr:glycosyltransferase family 39 protein [Pirellulales bacterium]